MTTPILSVRDVRKSYGRGSNRFDALKGVSLDIHEGESIAIIGKSGSGKSTLMHVLALLDTPTDGVVELDGDDTGTLRGARLNRTRNKTFGFVFQQFFLTPNASVLENVILPLKIAGVGRRERRRRGLAALEQLELDDKARNTAVNLSGGPEAAVGHRPRARERPADHLRRRAHRQPRHRHRRGRRGHPVRPAPRARHHPDRRHARRGARRPLRPPHPHPRRALVDDEAVAA